MTLRSPVMGRRPGFSMIEMMGTVIILAIMTAGVTLSVHKMGVTYDRYADVVVLHDMVALQQGIDMHARLYGEWPKDMASLMKSGVLIGDPETSKGNFIIVADKKYGAPRALFRDIEGNEHTLKDLLEGK